MFSVFDALQDTSAVMLVLASQQANSSLSTGDTWASLVTFMAPIATVLATPLFNYLAERRAQRDWAGILKAIDVYSRWAEIGDVETIVMLRRYINTSIEQQTESSTREWTYVIGGFCLTVEASLALWSLMRGKPYLAIPALGAFILITMMLRASRTNTRKRKEGSGGIDETYNELTKKTAEALCRAADFGLAYEALEKESQMDARVADILSSGDPLMRRLYRSALAEARVADAKSSGEQDLDDGIADGV